MHKLVVRIKYSQNVSPLAVKDFTGYWETNMKMDESAEV